MQIFSRRKLCFGLAASAAATIGGCGLPTLPDFDALTGAERLRTRALAYPDHREVYGAISGEQYPIAAFDYGRIDTRFLRQTVSFPAWGAAGSIVVDPHSRYLYFVESPGRATRYGVGVGKEGFGWSGRAKVQLKRNWPDWIPPAEMIVREPDIRARLRQTKRGLGVPGGPDSPLGARALYLFGEGRDLGYRIHGTLEPETIGTRISSGCIRMINQDVIHLYTRASLGTPVIVMA